MGSTTSAHYLNGPARWFRAAVADKPDARSAVSALLLGGADGLSQPDYPTGCLISLSATHGGSDLASHEAAMRAARLWTLGLLVTRLRQGVADGDLAPDTNVETPADVYEGVLRGMAMKAQDGASRQHLRALAQAAMTA